MGFRAIDPAWTDGYCRVSTSRQEEYGHALERYREDLLRAGVKPDRIFSDVESGGKEDRAGYQAILARVRSGATKKILVPCFDRFTRSSLDWEKAMRELQQYGATLEALSGGVVDVWTPEGRHKSRLDASFAEYIREKNRQASIDGWARRKRLGLPSNPPFCYRISTDGLRYELEESKKAFARELIEIFLESAGLGEAVKRFKARVGRINTRKAPHDQPPVSREGIIGWVTNPVLRGHVGRLLPAKSRMPEWEIVHRDTHAALVTQEEFFMIERLINNHARIPRSKNPTHMLSGLIYCECGASCQRVEEAFYCRATTPSAGLTFSCKRRGGVKSAVVESAIIRAIVSVSEALVDRLDPTTRTNVIPPELEALIRQLETLKGLGDLPEIVAARDAIQQRIDSFQTKEKAIDLDLEIKSRMLVAASDPEFWATRTAEQKRFVFVQLVDRVVKVGTKVLRVEFAGGLGVWKEDSN